MQDGSFLAACDLKKLVWYVKKELGQWEPELGPGSTQPTIRLTFQHKTTTDQASGNDFYNEVKANECVGCGEAGHYLKYKCDTNIATVDTDASKVALIPTGVDNNVSSCFQAGLETQRHCQLIVVAQACYRTRFALVRLQTMNN